MTREPHMPTIPASEVFERQDSDQPLTALTADVAVYIPHAISAHKDAVYRALDAFYSIVPPSSLKWYRTETMTKDKPCTPRALSIPKSWWKEDMELKPLRYMQIRDGDAYNSVPRCGVRLSCHELGRDEERPWEPSLVRFMLPAIQVAQDPNELLSLGRLLADELPISSGHAGYCIECNSYDEEESIRAAYPLAMRYLGADIDYRLSDDEFSFLKTVNWLTIVGDSLLDSRGGRAVVRRRIDDSTVTVHEAKHGLIFQAGNAPALGDVNRGEVLGSYRSVYRALADLFAPVFTPPFHLTVPRQRDVNEEKTEAWYRRYAREVGGAG
jgi:Protein of unknown function (DUF3396)